MFGSEVETLMSPFLQFGSVFLNCDRRRIKLAYISTCLLRALADWIVNKGFDEITSSNKILALASLWNRRLCQEVSVESPWLCEDA